MARRTFYALLFAVLAASTQSVASARISTQQPNASPSQQAPADNVHAATNASRPPHQVKIWTNEDLIETRTPMDRYIFDKEEKAASDRAAEFLSITSCFAPGNHEPTAEETQKDIADTTKAIDEAEEGVRQSRRQIAEDPENLRTRDQAELNRRSSDLNRLLEHLHQLQARIQETAPQTSSPASPEATPAPSPAPQPQ
jgi:chromosome segregation ATPase